MLIPLAIGSLAALLLVALVGSRNMLTFIIIEIFVSGALALAGATSAYPLFAGMYMAVVALWVLTHVEERVVERTLVYIIAIGLVWASDNTLAAKALASLSSQILAPLFSALATLGDYVFAGLGLGSLFAFMVLTPRILSLSEESPLVAIAYIYVANSILSALIAPLPDYLKLALGIALLYPLGEAVRGKLDSIAEVAPVIYLLPLAAQTLVQIGAVMALVELALGILSKRHLAAAAMWATATLLVA